MTPAPTPSDPRPWLEAWSEALYGPDGFYRRQAPADHFATSAQGVPGAGELLAEAVAALADQHGCTRVVDLGAGRGELLAHLREVAPALALTGIDVVDRPEALDGLGIDWWRSPGGSGLPPELVGLEDTLVLAHEWLDVVPARVVEREQAGSQVWREVLVTTAGDETLGRELDVVEDAADLSWLGRWVRPEVLRCETGRTREAACVDLLKRVDSGLAVLVDYGYRPEDQPVHGTLTAYLDGRQVDPVPDGTVDLTAHVATVPLLAAASTILGSTGTVRLTRQRDLLTDLLGATRGAVPAHELASSRPAAYLEGLRSSGALRALTEPGGLGDFWWLLVPRGRDA